VSNSAIRTHVRTLTLSHFRNYQTIRIEVDERPVVLVGPNGAGKTNMLEAISLLTPGRGLRRAALGDIENIHDSAPWAISAEVVGMQGHVNIGTGRDISADNASEKRIVRIEGKNTRQSHLSKVFAALWLTPQMDTLFIEGGTARRKFLDRLVYSFDSEHATRINAYDFAMRERNRLLQTGFADETWLLALEHKMAEQGIAITVARQHAVEGVNNVISLAQHSFPQAILSLAGTIESALLDSPALIAEEKFKEILAANRMQDRSSGRTLIGAHRSELKVIHREKNMPAEMCSTGEQKALLISIILAQAKAGAAWHGNVPVLLLDEVVTHLDSFRRGELFAEIAALGAQCWLTGTDVESFQGLDKQEFTIELGLLKHA
jgi:DNA replication and repair protein RecF